MGRDERSLPTRERRLGVSSWERRLSLLESSPYNLFKRGEQKCGSLFCVSPAPAGEPAAGAPCARSRCGAPAGPCLLGTRAWGAVITQPLGRSPAGEVMRGAPAPTANLSVQGALRSPPPTASLAGRSHGLLLLSRFQKVVHSEPDFLDHHGDLEWTLQFQNERRTARWGYPGGGGTPGLRPRICLLATGSGGK